MSSTFTGSAADPTTSPQATCPSDGDSGNSASVNGAFQSILNFISWLRTKIAPVDGNNTFTGYNTFSSTTTFSVPPNVPTPYVSAQAARRDMAGQDGMVTKIKTTLHQSLSSSSGAFFTNSTSDTDVTNLWANFASASAHPVRLTLIPEWMSSAEVGVEGSSGGQQVYSLSFWHDGTRMASFTVRATTTGTNISSVPPGAFTFIDTSVTTATVAYKVSVKVISGASPIVYVTNCVLVVEEM
jgi:hypothetical protein